MQTTRSLIPSLFAKPRGGTGANQHEKAQLGRVMVLQTQDTKPDAALTVAHAV